MSAEGYHKRLLKVEYAKTDMSRSIVGIAVQNGLTAPEVVTCLLAIANRYADEVVRDERHPNDRSKKSSEA